LGRGAVLSAADAAAAKDWIAKQRASVAAGQGIVVGGAHASDIRILHNTIVETAEGIRVGLSMRNARTQPVFVDRVESVGNTITKRVVSYERGAHAGIFVGNATFATVRDNDVTGEIIDQPTYVSAQTHVFSVGPSVGASATPAKGPVRELLVS